MAIPQQYYFQLNHFLSALEQNTFWKLLFFLSKCLGLFIMMKGLYLTYFPGSAASDHEPVPKLETGYMDMKPGTVSSGGATTDPGYIDMSLSSPQVDKTTCKKNIFIKYKTNNKTS